MRQATAGVDLGGTKIQAVIMSSGIVVGQSRHQTPKTDAADVIAEIVASIRSALDTAGMEPSALRAVAIGTPGSVEVTTGHVSNARNVPGFVHDVALGPTVGAAFPGTPVIVDNDVRAAVMGEFRRGAGRRFNNLLGVFVGTGVGGGLILKGELHHGRGNTGEIGHTTVKPGGRRCGCTRLGCLEAYAGRLSIEQTARHRIEKGQKTKLFDIMQRKGRDRVTSSVIADALEQNDHLTIELIDEAVEALGLALANAQNLLDLEAIIVGGGLGDRLGDPFVRRVEQAMARNLRFPESPPEVLGTELRDLSGAVGATVLIEERLIEERLIEERLIEERLIEERLTEERLIEERLIGEGNTEEQA
ncbi:MAG: ROK family protein [Acidimicrobiales bacterium]|nr:ROK family protein [Acidimicrobiales bacterium]